MEEILRDSEKDQNNFTALQEGPSDASDQAAGEEGSAAVQTNQPSLHLVLDPSNTGSAKVLPTSIIYGFFFFFFMHFQVNFKMNIKLSGA